MNTYRISIDIEANSPEEAEQEFYEVISGSQSLNLNIQGIHADKPNKKATQ